MAKKVKKATKKTVRKKKKAATKTIKLPTEVEFDYIKSNFFRVIRVDGAHGGIGPKANSIQLALFSERQAIPQKEVYSIKDGKLNEDPKKRLGRTAIIREVEIEAIVDISTAKSLRDWLNDKINIVEKIRSQVKTK